MVRRHRFVPARRWLLPVLALLFVLGHACEAPAYAALVGTPHVTEDADHPAHDHGQKPQLSCDAVETLVSNGSVRVAPRADGAEIAVLGRPVPVRLVTAPVEDQQRPPSRPPLFLLHASLLI